MGRFGLEKHSRPNVPNFHLFSLPFPAEKAYVDEHVEARYEEIIIHLHKALSSTEEDEQDFKVNEAFKI